MDASVDAVCLCGEDDRDTLHDGGAIHVDGGTERDGERGNSPVDTDFLFEGLDVERDGRVGRGGRERERDDREELLQEAQRVESGEDEQQDHVDDAQLDGQTRGDGTHVLEQRHERVEAQVRERAGDHAEDTDGSELHDEVRHLHHEVVGLRQEVGDDRAALFHLGEQDAHEKREQDDLEHGALRQ